MILQNISTGSEELTEKWRLKFSVSDFKNVPRGWVEIIFYSVSSETTTFLAEGEYSSNENFTSSSSTSTPTYTNYYNSNNLAYCAEIFSNTDLPFWFFTGKSETYEKEFYNENFLPQKSDFKINSSDGNYTMTLKTSEKSFHLTLVSDKKNKEKFLSVPHEDIITPGNLREKIRQKNFLTKTSHTFYLLDKFKQDFRKVNITTTGKTFLNQIECYKIKFDLNLLGKFTIWVDDDLNIIYGEGMGIRIFP